ncbi:Brefeldin A resistance protein [Verticillium dahliae VDG2]|nr:Brefeldin A resistance protein [Verticillium dahliae VDG2]
MKFSGLLYLATLASAASVDLSKRDSPLDIKIEKVGNTVIKASITNTGASDLKVLKTGSILDELEVEKSEIFSGSKKVEFDGVRLQLDTTALSEESFQVLVAGETVELTWDVAHVHDLSAGGEFDISANGRFSYAESDSTELTGVATYASNVVHSTVDGEEAAKVRRDFHETIKRAVSSTTATRNTVAGVFNRIASECGSSTGGVSRQYCTDIYPACSSGVIAYTLPSQSYMVNCPYYFSSFPAQSRTCRAIDQATTTLHEVTHLTQIRGTQDYNCYG